MLASRPFAQRLSLQLAKGDEKLQEFRDKLRDTRAELESKTRQLDVAKGLVARLGDEKRAAEVRRTPHAFRRWLC